MTEFGEGFVVGVVLGSVVASLTLTGIFLLLVHFIERKNRPT